MEHSSLIRLIFQRVRITAIYGNWKLFTQAAQPVYVTSELISFNHVLYYYVSLVKFPWSPIVTTTNSSRTNIIWSPQYFTFRTEYLFPETPRTEIPWTQTPAPLDTDPPGQRPPGQRPYPWTQPPPCGQADTCDYWLCLALLLSE